MLQHFSSSVYKICAFCPGPNAIFSKKVALKIKNFAKHMQFSMNFAKRKKSRCRIVDIQLDYVVDLQHNSATCILTCKIGGDIQRKQSKSYRSCDKRFEKNVVPTRTFLTLGDRSRPSRPRARRRWWRSPLHPAGSPQITESSLVAFRNVEKKDPFAWKCEPIC